MIADVRGKNVLVIGGTRGIGNAIARGLHHEGARVSLTGRDPAAAGRAAAALGADVRGYGVDVRVRAAIDAAIGAADADFDGVDALVYSAGISPAFTSGEKLDPAAWDDIMAVNVTGAFLAAQAFARCAIARTRPGSIVFIGSISGLAGAAKLAAYSASKAALVGLTKSLAWDWARYRIRVNVLAPGWVRTDLNAGIQANDALMRWIEARTPQGRMAAPEEIVGLAAFLVSDAASFATGAVYALDGGWTAG